MHAAFDGDQVVGGAGAYSYDFTVPGGSLPCAGVTVVGVYPTHRRRGALRGMMLAQLADVHERGEPIAALWASEETIYGRFGYGIASWACEMTLPRVWSAFAQPLERRGRVRFVSAEEAAELFPPVWEALRRERPGVPSRSDGVVEAALAADPGRGEGEPAPLRRARPRRLDAGVRDLPQGARLDGRKLEREARGAGGDRSDAAGDRRDLAVPARRRLDGDDQCVRAPARPSALPAAGEPAPRAHADGRLAVGAARRRRRRPVGPRVRRRRRGGAGRARRRVPVERRPLARRSRRGEANGRGSRTSPSTSRRSAPRTWAQSRSASCDPRCAWRS